MHRLESTWVLSAPREPVWDALRRTSEWPHWWPYVLAVHTIVEGEAGGCGAVRRILWRTALPYLVRVELELREAEAPTRLLAAARGGLRGTSCWSLSEHDGATAVNHRAELEACGPLLRGCSWLLSPVVRWNHARVMQAGAAGMARYLHCRLLALDGRRIDAAVRGRNA